MISMANNRSVLVVLVMLTGLVPPLRSQDWEPPEIDRGESLTITGKVVRDHPDGVPVAGAEIYIVKWSRNTNLRRWFTDLERKNVGNSGPDGRFSFQLPRKGTWFLWARSDDGLSSFRGEYVPIAYEMPPVTTDPVIVLTAAAPVTITVVDASGSPLADCDLIREEAVWITKTGKDGKGTLLARLGEQDLVVMPPAGYTIGTATIEVKDTDNEVEVSVQKAGTLAGTIRDTENKPVSNVTISARSENLIGDHAISDEQGTFRISRVPMDVPLTVRISDERYHRWSREGIEVKRSTDSAIINPILQAHPSRTVTFRLIDENDQPIKNVQFGFPEKTTDENGLVDISFRENSPSEYLDPPGYQFIRLEASHYLGSGPYDVVLKKKSFIQVSGMVVDTHGRPIAGVTILGCRSLSQSHSRDYKTGPDGRFELACNVKLPLNLTFQRSGYQVVSLPRPYENQSDLQVVLKPSKTFSYRVIEATTGKPILDYNASYRSANNAAAIMFNTRQHEWQTSPTEPDGTTVAGEVLTDDALVHIRIEAPGYESNVFEDVDVCTGERISLQLKPKRNLTMTGQVIDWRDQPVPDAQVKLYTLPASFRDNPPAQFQPQGLEHRKLNLQETTSDRFGRFTLNQISTNGTLFLHIQAAGMAPFYEVRPPVGHADSIKPVNAVLGQMGTVIGRFDVERLAFPVIIKIFSDPAEKSIIPIVKTKELDRLPAELPLGDLPPGDYWISLSRKWKANAYYLWDEKFTVKAGETTRLDSKTNPDLALEGRVFSGETPVAKRAVTLAIGKSPWQSTVTDANGAFRFEGLLPRQSYTLLPYSAEKCLAAGHKRSFSLQPQEKVYVHERNVNQDIILTEIAEVRGRIEYLGPRHLSISGTNMQSEVNLETQVLDNGQFTLPQVPYGTYKLHVSGSLGLMSGKNYSWQIANTFTVNEAKVDWGTIAPTVETILDIECQWPTESPPDVRGFGVKIESADFSTDTSSSGGDGNYFRRLIGLPADTYEVILSAGRVGILQSPHRFTIHLEPGKTVEVGGEVKGWTRFLGLLAAGPQLPDNIQLIHTESGEVWDIKYNPSLEPYEEDASLPIWRYHYGREAFIRGLQAGTWRIQWTDEKDQQHKDITLTDKMETWVTLP